MSIFEYIVAALLLVAGLGITQLLGDAVDVFRSRQRLTMRWLPLAWIGLVFVWQMQFVWAIFELNDFTQKKNLWACGMVVFAVLTAVAVVSLSPVGYQ